MMWAAGLTVMASLLEPGEDGASGETGVTVDVEDTSEDCLLVEEASLPVVISGLLTAAKLCEVNEALRLDESFGLNVVTASVISEVSLSPLLRPLILIFLIDLITGESLPDLL